LSDAQKARAHAWVTAKCCERIEEIGQQLMQLKRLDTAMDGLLASKQQEANLTAYTASSELEVERELTRVKSAIAAASTELVDLENFVAAEKILVKRKEEFRQIEALMQATGNTEIKRKVRAQQLEISDLQDKVTQLKRNLDGLLSERDSAQESVRSSRTELRAERAKVARVRIEAAEHALRTAKIYCGLSLLPSPPPVLAPPVTQIVTTQVRARRLANSRAQTNRLPRRTSTQQPSTQSTRSVKQ